MSDTRCQTECERWVRDNWLPAQFGMPFEERTMPLSSGGVFKFDAVSEDGSVIASISTSKAAMSSGKRGVGKLMKIRSDMFFHVMAGSGQHVLVFTEDCMLTQLVAERERGRVPQHLQLLKADLPPELATRLHAARTQSSSEVRARRPEDTA